MEDGSNLCLEVVGCTLIVDLPQQSQVQLPEGVTPFVHITQNEFLGRKHKKLKEEDVAVCECKYGVNDPETACVERCLNVLTSIECTLGYYQSGENCRNQIYVEKNSFMF
ncbi:hypothetical protein KY290_038336 [Solanum tuberosum]|uniref:AWS domain-containing protein n=1 Tax=Solanum tuberosum TaxID=4113 RepID=A0ABQ7TY54_SOLTU|nr:hypothetical protein KY289_038210 [Solanum tuberosum]KAH0639406.1 hypothetical protein KY285_035992 [Solanum tuberosum]KAH0739631.1 hypothetical protein KY290_038336 [Solanum tuberosum]